MNIITHALTGWCLAEMVPGLGRREKGWITFAAVAPDLDGLGAIAELSTEHTARPLLWWTEYHHVLAHNLLFAMCMAIGGAWFARTARVRTALLAFVAVHTHIAGDVLGSRGPDGYQWPIPYLYPFRSEPELIWAGQWYLNAWPNIVMTIVLMAVTIWLAWRRGYSIVGLFSTRGDRAFVEALRRRFAIRPA
jgi:inner membrane protein